jgi:hypothetical protein
MGRSLNCDRTLKALNFRWRRLLKKVQAWPIVAEQPLPIVLIPLQPGDSTVLVDLQKAPTVVYDIIGNDQLLDYRQPP